MSSALFTSVSSEKLAPLPSLSLEKNNSDAFNYSLKTSNNEKKSELDIKFFDVDDKGKPLCERKLRGLSHFEWVVFNLKCFVTTVGRTFKWISALISIIRQKGDSVEKIKSLRLMGGVIAKIMQAIGSNDELVKAVFDPVTSKEFDKIKIELNKIMSDNTGLSVSEIIEFLDKSGICYDKEKSDDIEVLGAGTVATVASVPMKDGSVKAIKIIDKRLEILFLSDISIIKKFLGLLSIFKPKILGSGSKKAIIGFLETIKKEFDLRYEAQNTIIQKGVTERISKGENLFNIKESTDCPCDAKKHGDKSVSCKRYLSYTPEKPKEAYIADFFDDSSDSSDSSICGQLKKYLFDDSYDRSNSNSEEFKKYFLAINGDDEVLKGDDEVLKGDDEVLKGDDEVFHDCSDNGFEFKLKTPSIDITLSTRDMLVMDKIDGVTLSATLKEIKEKVISKIYKFWGAEYEYSDNDINSVLSVCKKNAFCVWEKGLYNEGKCSSDIHFGNAMLAVEGTKIAIYNIDFGNYVSLDKEAVVSIYSILSAIDIIFRDGYYEREGINFDQQSIEILKKGLECLGTPAKKGVGINWDALERDIIKGLKEKDESVDYNFFIMTLLDISFKNDLIISPSIIGLFRARLLFINL